MTTDTAAGIALGLYLLGVLTTFGVRTWLHHRRTGTTGYRGLSGAPGSAQWWGGILFVAALVLGAAGPALALAGTRPAPLEVPAVLRWLGAAVAVLGFLAVLAAQTGMGSSWRIGVDPGERTTLVTSGAFALVRNPIFTAMITALAGLTLLVPTLTMGLAFACLVVAIELQVRVVEEPYLRRTHEQEYTQYARRVGRFVPGVGRLL
jgi:protein-S-isoprenylcysteine O-methyltransferase Ste14